MRDCLSPPLCDCPINFRSEEVLAVPQHVWRSQNNISNFQINIENFLDQFQEKEGEKQSVGVPSAT